MRIWSISPKYLDTKGLLAVWREGLLAKKVLEGNTIGYINHPQLYRFKNHKDPLGGINSYLKQIYDEALKRNYKFDNGKFKEIEVFEKIPVTQGQVLFEYGHLLEKLQRRDIPRYEVLKVFDKVEINDIFELIEGEIEPWEKI